MTHTHNHHDTIIPSKPVKASKNNKYYCPMHCEGEKLYDEPGNCPVCGMHLVPMNPTDEDNTYQGLLKKFKVAALFTVPIFIISMGEMIPGNPIVEILPPNISNWLQFLFSLPVIFYATWMFFQRAWLSIRTWNLNMFTLIGIGAGAAFLFSVFALLFPSFFPDQFKGHDGYVHLYFEAATVILTLVLLGQLLESRAHSQTSGAVKALLELSPTDAIRVVDGQDELISIHDIQKGYLLRVKPGEKIPVDGKIELPGLTTAVLCGLCSPKSSKASTSRESSTALLRLLIHTSICVMFTSEVISGAKASASLKCSRKY